MITNFIRNMVQMGGTSTFEKARLSATFKGDYDQPSESDIQGKQLIEIAILLTLGNKDPETRPQIGFTKIVEKMEKSDSKIYWNYIVKNLIILDRCIEYNYFVQDIAQMEVNYVKNYTETNAEFKRNNVDGFIQKYYNYIKTKANLYSKRNSSFNIPKEEKKIYFNQQSIDQIFEELIQSQRLHDVILDLGSSDRNGLLKFKVNQYVFMLLMTTLINLYSTQYISILALLGKMLNMDINSIKKLRDLYNQFLKNNEKLIAFINSHRNLKGYADVNIYEIGRIDPRIIMSIEEYMRIVEKPTSNLSQPEEVILEQGWIDTVLKVEEGYDIRQSIHDFEKQNKQYLANRQSIIQQTLDSKLTDQPMEFKILQYLKNHKDQFAQIAPFDENIFWAFHNNFSLEYIPIETQFKQQPSTNQNIRYDSLSPRASKYQFDLQKDDLIIFKSLVQLDEQIFLQFENFYCFQIQYSDRKSIAQDTAKEQSLDEIKRVSESSEPDEKEIKHHDQYKNLHSELQDLLQDDEQQLLNPKNIPIIQESDKIDHDTKQINKDSTIIKSEQNKVGMEPNFAQFQQVAPDIDLDNFDDFEDNQPDHIIDNNIQQLDQKKAQQTVISDYQNPVPNLDDDDIDLNQFEDIDQNTDPQQKVDIKNIDKNESSLNKQANIIPNTQVDQDGEDDIDLDKFGEIEEEQDNNIIKNTSQPTEQVQEVIFEQDNQNEIDLDQFGDFDKNSKSSQQQVEINKVDDVQLDVDKYQQEHNDIDLDAFGELDEHDIDNNNKQHPEKSQELVQNQDVDIDLDQFGEIDNNTESQQVKENQKEEINIEKGEIKLNSPPQEEEMDLGAFGELEEGEDHPSQKLVSSDQQNKAESNSEIDLDQFGDFDQDNQQQDQVLENGDMNSNLVQKENNEIKTANQEVNNDVDLDAFGKFEDDDQDNKQQNEKPQEQVISDEQNKSKNEECELDLDQFGDFDKNSDSYQDKVNEAGEVNLDNFKNQLDENIPQPEIKSTKEIDLDAFGEFGDLDENNNSHQHIENGNAEISLEAFGNHQEVDEKSNNEINLDAFGELEEEQHHIVSEQNQKAQEVAASDNVENQEDEIDFNQFGDFDNKTDSQQDIEDQKQVINLEKDESKPNFTQTKKEDNEIDLDAFGELEDHDTDNNNKQHEKSQEVVFSDQQNQFENQDHDIDLDQFGDFDNTESQHQETQIAQINLENKADKDDYLKQDFHQEANAEIDLDAFGELEEEQTHTIEINNTKATDERKVVNPEPNKDHQEDEIDLDQFGDLDDLDDA